MRSKKIEDLKKNLKLSEYQREIVIGLLLGDGHLETQNDGRTYRLKIEHTFWQKEYTDWLYRVFERWVLTPPQEKRQIVKGVEYCKYWFSTVSHGAFRFYGQQFYRDKRKILPSLIRKWLTPMVIAIWFMGDGSIKSKRHKALIINTQGFAKNEILILIDILENKFNVKANLRKQRNLYQILVTGESAKRFSEIIKPYILPSMMYKLGLLGNKIA